MKNDHEVMIDKIDDFLNFVEKHFNFFIMVTIIMMIVIFIIFFVRV